MRLAALGVTFVTIIIHERIVRFFKAHANGRNIVGRQHPTLLGPTKLSLVATICMEPQQCWHLLALVAYSLKPVKLLGPCKRTQHCWSTTPNNVGSCWHLLRPFAWAFTRQFISMHYVNESRLCLHVARVIVILPLEVKHEMPASGMFSLYLLYILVQHNANNTVHLPQYNTMQCSTVQYARAISSFASITWEVLVKLFVQWEQMDHCILFINRAGQVGLVSFACAMFILIKIFFPTYRTVLQDKQQLYSISTTIQ